MKTLNSINRRNKLSSPLILIRKFIKPLSWFLMIVMLHFSVSCKYFKVKEVPVANNNEISQKLDELNDSMRYVVIHSGENYYHLSDLSINSDDNSFSGKVLELPQMHKYKKRPLIDKTYKYNDDKQSPLNELHIYLKSPKQLSVDSTVNFPINDIKSIALVDKNTGRTVANIVLGVIGGIALLIALAAALKGSCPFIYTYDGQDYVFSGELYPGNIIKNAQVLDFNKLPNLCDVNGFYKIKVSNELLEIEHTDQVNLIAVDHSFSSEVLLDSNGNLVLFNEQVSPISVYEDGYSVDTEILLKVDNQYLSFNSNNTNSKGTREVVLKFRKPVNTTHANLKLSAKNSLWMDMLFGKMNEKFGSYYPTFQKNQQDLTKEKAEEWKENQSISLSVSILENGVWNKVSDIPSAGPLVFRDFGISLNLDHVKGEFVEIKLETGFMFWELDHAAMSFDTTGEYKIHRIKPTNAITNDGRDVTYNLSYADGKYHIQDEIGQSVEVSFNTPPQELNVQRSFFIQSKGYYTYIRDYTGIPNFTELLQFRKPGHFPRYSEMQYNEKIIPFINADNSLTIK